MKNKTIKKLALKHLNKKKTAINNRKKINDILLNLKYTIDKENIKFGNGYFLFEFEENSIAWFYLKEFKDWKFGIWLNTDNTYLIFGEAITLIDKFKPSASTLSHSNIKDFNLSLNKILNNENEWKEYNENEWKEYNENVKRGLEQDLLNNEYNKRNLEKIKEYIAKIENEYDNFKVDSYLKLVDRNTKDFKILPRYTINEFTDKKHYFDNKDTMIRTKSLFLNLCNLIEYTGNDNLENNDYISNDEFIFKNLLIQNPKDYKNKIIRYNYKDFSISEYFDDFFEKQKGKF